MNILKLKSDIINYLFIVAIFSAYSLFKISSFYVQIVFVCMIIIYFLSICFISFNREKMDTYIITLCFMIYLLLNWLTKSNATVTSLILVSFYFGLIFLTYRDIEENKFNKLIDIYIKVVSILAIYGIYQFFGRKYGLPFSDLRISQHMVGGFNWSNKINIANNTYYRSNAICLEPSFFSQYLAMNIGFLLVKFDNNLKDYKIIFLMIINFIALVMSFSGSGVLLLITILLWYFIKNISIKHMLKYLLIGALTITIIIMICLILNKVYLINNIISYFLSRINEFHKSKMSGSVRFRESYLNMMGLISQYPVFGKGIGSTFNWFEIRTSTIARVTSEIGILGIVLWILFLISLVNKNNIKNKYYNIILIFIFLGNILGENFATAFYWAFIYLVNCKIVFKNKK
ncbi:hypothetical protein D4Z93_01750 [Clostridium fermenticellae]|uniref:O-antigen ligase domain-containing protein n=1 Tax=Clostridium fermenticellae TaxID=2068654 RepID=A0A386H191_9CLOT|nr:hypothetical protein [Clostridium fermenticellae]AYD39333.1 hypothetical protein D4Z93_01750 [Clostridium fermenticellae]